MKARSGRVRKGSASRSNNDWCCSSIKAQSGRESFAATSMHSRDSSSPLSSEITLQAHKVRVLLIFHDSKTTASPCESPFIEDGCQFNQEPTGYIAIDNFKIVMTASREMRRNFTGSVHISSAYI